MTQEELMTVLDALTWCRGGEPCGTAEAIVVVEKALAQPVQQEPVADSLFLERVLCAMEGVIDVADRKTNEFDLLRTCIIDLTLILHTKQPTQQQPAHQEPEWYHFVRHGEDCFVSYKGQAPENATPLYTSPPPPQRTQQPAQRTWAGLTQQDYNEIFAHARNGENAVQLAEAKLKEKNQ